MSKHQQMSWSYLWAPVTLYPLGEEEGEGAEGEQKPPEQKPPEQKIPEADKKLAETIKERNQLAENYKNLKEEMEALQTKSTLTQEERTTLQNKIKDLDSKVMTQEQLKAEAVKKAQEQTASELKEAKDKGSLYQNLYEGSLVNEEVATAAKAVEMSPRIIKSILQTEFKIDVQQVTDQDNKPVLNKDGLPTFETLVNYPTKDQSGNPTILKLSIPDAVKKMSEDDNYADVFSSGEQGGLGRKSSKAEGSEDDLVAVAKSGNFAAYKEQAKKAFGKSV